MKRKPVKKGCQRRIAIDNLFWNFYRSIHRHDGRIYKVKDINVHLASLTVPARSNLEEAQ